MLSAGINYKEQRTEAASDCLETVTNEQITAGAQYCLQTVTVTNSEQQQHHAVWRQ